MSEIIELGRMIREGAVRRYTIGMYNGVHAVSAFHKGKVRYFNCICPCGKNFECRSTHIGSGKTKSCGCFYKDFAMRTKWRGHEQISGQLWCDMKASAKARNHYFDITIQYAWNLFIEQERRCNLSGVDLIFGKKVRTASLDRIDSTKGYIVGNVQWVHKVVNNMKNKMTEPVFIEWCRKVVNQAA